MKIIQVHNYYQQAGGEDAVVEAERVMLEEHGNIVITFYKSNDDISRGQQSEDRGQGAGDGQRRSVCSRLSSVIGLLRVSAQTIWNHTTYREFRKLLQQEQPNVVHCHNTFPLISPSIYWACAKEKVPVVQTLHNFRMMCATPFLYRQGHICERCVGKIFPYPAVAYRCYRKSRAGSLVWAVMIFIHRLLGTWTNKVSSYIALTEFQKRKMIEGGVPADKIWVKPNFIQRTDVGEQTTEADIDRSLSNTQCLMPNASQSYALFVGRLSDEKGCDVLLKAWAVFQQAWSKAHGAERSPSTNIQEPATQDNQPQLIIVGDGPERATLEKLSSDLCLPSSVTFLGLKPKDEVLSLMRDAQFLVFPSVWYETFGLTVFEAGLVKTPAVISAPTTTSSLISKDVTGMVFPMGDVEVLAEKLLWAFDHPDEMAKMGEYARTDFETRYSARANYRMLMEIYERALGSGDWTFSTPVSPT